MSLLTINKSLGKSAPRLNELGKIKIGGLGAEKTSGGGKTFRAPAKYDHFLITTMHREGGKGDGDLIEDVELTLELLAKHGSPSTKASKPGRQQVLRELPIWFPTNDISDALQTSWVWYKGRTTLGARSDGDQVTWYCHPNTGEELAKPEVSEWKDTFARKQFRGAPMFKLNSVLSCLIASDHGRFGGVYKFRTTSVVSYDKLYGSLVDITAKTRGVLRNMPLMLVVEPVQVKPQGKVSTIYAVRVELRGKSIRAIEEKANEERRWQIEHQQEAERLTKQYRALLLPPGKESPAEMPGVVDEFYPETAYTITPAAADSDMLDGLVEGGVDLPPPASEPPPPNDVIDPDPAVVQGDSDDEPGAAEEFARFQEEQSRINAADASAAAAGGVNPDAQSPIPRRRGLTPEQEAEEIAALKPPAKKPVTPDSTLDEFLAFVVEHRPETTPGRRSDAMTAMAMATKKVPLFLPKPWAKLTPQQRAKQIERVKAGKFPWGV